jgi:large conductance mechanosensitive channel
MFKEFRDFIARGNAMDLAVGIIIGAAFTAIVNSLVQDLINPVIGLFTGGVDFSNLFFALSTESYASVAAAEEAGVAVFKYGSFITAVINFLIIAWVVFLLVRAINRLKSATAKPVAPAPAVPTGPTQEELLVEIRDTLRAQTRAG